MLASTTSSAQTLMMADYPKGYSMDNAAGALASFIEKISSTDLATFEVISKTEALDQIVIKWTIGKDEKDAITETTVAYFLYQDSVGAGILKCKMIYNGKEYEVVESDSSFKELYNSQKLLFLETFFSDYLKLEPTLADLN